MFLHREVFTQRSFYTQKLFHTEVFTHPWICSKKHKEYISEAAGPHSIAFKPTLRWHRGSSNPAEPTMRVSSKTNGIYDQLYIRRLYNRLQILSGKKLLLVAFHILLKSKWPYLLAYIPTDHIKLIFGPLKTQLIRYKTLCTTCIHCTHCADASLSFLIKINLFFF